MVELIFQESIPMYQFSSGKEILYTRFQILPHGQQMISFNRQDSSEINFLLRNSAEQPWKLANFSLQAKKGRFIENFFHIIDNSGNFLLIFSQKDSIQNNNYTLYSALSHNYGKTWNTPIQISPEEESWIPTGSISILETGFQTGKIILPLFNPHLFRIFSLSSDDNGKHWNFSLFVEPEDLEKINDNEKNIPYVFPGTKNARLIELSDSTLQIFCQNYNNITLQTSMSTDIGHTWTETSPLSKFPGTLEGDFDIQNIINFDSVDSEHDKIIFVGNKKINSKYQIVLWKMDLKTQEFKEIWCFKELFDHPIKKTNLFRENRTNLHLIFQKSSSELMYLEFSV